MFSHFECTVKHSHFCQITNKEELRLPTIIIILDTIFLCGKDSTYKIHTKLSGSLTSENIDVISCSFTVVCANRQFVYLLKRKLQWFEDFTHWGCL